MTSYSLKFDDNHTIFELRTNLQKSSKHHFFRSPQPPADSVTAGRKGAPTAAKNLFRTNQLGNRNAFDTASTAWTSLPRSLITGHSRKTHNSERGQAMPCLSTMEERVLLLSEISIKRGLPNKEPSAEWIMTPLISHGGTDGGNARADRRSECREHEVPYYTQFSYSILVSQPPGTAPRGSMKHDSYKSFSF